MFTELSVPTCIATECILFDGNAIGCVMISAVPPNPPGSVANYKIKSDSCIRSASVTKFV